MDTMEKATHREHSTFGMNKNEISIIVAPPTTMDWIDVGLTSSNCAGQKQKKKIITQVGIDRYNRWMYLKTFYRI